MRIATHQIYSTSCRTKNDPENERSYPLKGDEDQELTEPHSRVVWGVGNETAQTSSSIQNRYRKCPAFHLREEQVSRHRSEICVVAARNKESFSYLVRKGKALDGFAGEISTRTRINKRESGIVFKQLVSCFFGRTYF